MFKIGEFSKITQVSIRMLRYYDEQKLLIPDEVDATSGYRLYSASQIERLNRIILLRNLGFNVKEIKGMIENWKPEMLKQDLLKQAEKIEENILKEQEKLKQIQGYLIDLENQDKKLNIQIVMKSIPQQHVISLRRVMPDYYSEGVLWQELDEAVKGIKELDTSKSFSVYHDLDDREQDVDIKVCVVVDEKKLDFINNQQSKVGDLIYRQVEGVELAACFMIYGPYSNISMAYKEFAYWLEGHPEYQMVGENRQICHVSACDTANPEDYITELQVPLKRVEHSFR